MKTTHRDLAAIKNNSLDHNLWQALQLFALYRLGLAIGFIAIEKFEIELNIFSNADELFYFQISSIYFTLSVLFLLLSLFFKRHYFAQANIPIFMDIIFIILFMHVSGGILSGIGILLVIIIAAHSLLVPGKISLFSAAFATIGIFFEQTHSILTAQSTIENFSQVAMLGIALFVSAAVTSLLSIRVRNSQAMLEKQTEQLFASQQLNAHIISQMQAGVLVLDSQHEIRLINLAAQKIIATQGRRQIHSIQDLPSSLQLKFEEFQNIKDHHGHHQVLVEELESRIHFHTLGKEFLAGTLIFIFDSKEETKRALELKLQSLGHLTANIAHELRNPLGAISHAAQLLAESSHHTEEDRKLIKMIKHHCDRMNNVIQSVMSLSASKPANRTDISLIPWLKKFINELSIPNIHNPDISLQYDTPFVSVHVDPNQLTQIFMNLFENGLRYSLRHSGQATLQIHVQATVHPLVAYIDITDQGPGLSSEDAKHVFEPFFTTEKTGSGLGLYIAKELCIINGIRLEHMPRNGHGCQFRLSISHGGQ